MEFELHASRLETRLETRKCIVKKFIVEMNI